MQSKIIKDYYHNNDLEEVKELQFNYSEFLQSFNLDTLKKEFNIKTENNNQAKVEIATSLIYLLVLKKYFRGITYNCLKIVVNYDVIEFYGFINENQAETLLKAMCLLVVLQQSNHFLRRYLNQDKLIQSIQTSCNPIQDRGERMFFVIFGSSVINHLTISQAEELLNINN